MNTYDQSLQVMNDLFAKDCQFSLATVNGSVPSVRIVDTFYDDGAFYVIAHASTQKVKEITANENVALCHNLYRFSARRKTSAIRCCRKTPIFAPSLQKRLPAGISSQQRAGRKNVFYPRHSHERLFL